MTCVHGLSSENSLSSDNLDPLSYLLFCGFWKAEFRLTLEPPRLLQTGARALEVLQCDESSVLAELLANEKQHFNTKYLLWDSACKGEELE